MKVTGPAALLAVCGIASAAPGQSSGRSQPLRKRHSYDVCNNDCALAGVAIPSADNFQLPLENNWSEQCPPIYIGTDPAHPVASSRVCLSFAGPYVTFDVEPFKNTPYTISAATITWKLAGNALSPTFSAPIAPITCTSGVDGHFACQLAFADVLGLPTSTPIKDLLAGMCPNGDREGLAFTFDFAGTAVDGSGNSVTFQENPLCASRNSDRSCGTYSGSSPSYIAMSYRCSKCETPACPPPPPTMSCDFGTAFGYQVGDSTTLDTQSGEDCNRWGWYETPTLAELQSGISGPLYVGAGGNDISKAINVGTWTAIASPTGGVTVTYTLSPPYALARVRIDLDCLPMDRCTPGRYTYRTSDLGDLPVYANPAPLQYPTCSGGSVAYLTINAVVDIITTATTCDPPKAA